MPCSQGVANALNERDTRVSQSENIKAGEGGGRRKGEKGETNPCPIPLG